MPYETDDLDFRKGDPLLARQLQAILDEMRRPSQILRAGAGLSARQGAHGQTQITGEKRLGFFGVASGNISPRSGSTMGTGTVTRHQVNITSGDDVATTINYPVWNPSSNTMASGNGINSGQYCWVQEDDDGNLIVTPLECS